ncbi:MAG: glycosyltransferase [Candidatus Aegiribacteria sp.]|nr:glycosyltransferase [Candidatus Aegiribacteria sp.]MBD3295068.1 glycosyltransferase [Candidatus Fermentibacteria bacterium]
MKILHLVHRCWPYHGGAERYVLEHALAADRWGHESVIYTTDAWDMSRMVSRSGKRVERREDHYCGVPIRRFPVRHPPLQDLMRGILRRLLSCGQDRFFYPNPFVPSLGRWLKRDSGFHMVHANAMPFLIYRGWRYGRRHGTGLVSVPHANVGEKYRRVEALHYFRGCQKRIFRESSFVVAQSIFEKGLFLEAGVPRERIHVSGSGVDPAEFRDADGSAGRERLGLSGRVILCMTAHSRDRGTGHLLRAASVMAKKGMDFTLVLAGPMDTFTDSILDSDDYLRGPLRGRVVTTGYVKQQERTDLLAAADMVVLPSRLDCFGIVLLEAWILGKPVVGCWSGAMPDLIKDGKNGFLVTWGDPVTLEDRMRRLLDDCSMGKKMGEEGRKAVLGRWTWDRVTDRFYRRLAMCHSGRRRP